jgi:hypothetical protein
MCYITALVLVVLAQDGTEGGGGGHRRRSEDQGRRPAPAPALGISGRRCTVPSTDTDTECFLNLNSHPFGLMKDASNSVRSLCPSPSH